MTSSAPGRRACAARARADWPAGVPARASSGPASTTTYRTPAARSARVSGPREVTMRFSRIESALSGARFRFPTASPSLEMTSRLVNLAQGSNTAWPEFQG